VSIEYFIIALTVILIATMLFNRKARIVKVFVEQLKVFKNDRTQKVYFWDILSFIVCPTLLSLIMVIWYDFRIDKEFAQILTTAFSLIFTLLLAFKAILIGKKNSGNEIEKEVIKQTFVSVVSASVLSMIGIILSITIMLASNCVVLMISTMSILALSFMTIMLLLMIIKRTFVIFTRDDQTSKKD